MAVRRLARAAGRVGLGGVRRKAGRRSSAEECGGAAQGADPVEGCGGGSGVGVAGTFVVAQRAERFDVFVVLPPAAGDDVVVEMGEPATELVDPGS